MELGSAHSGIHMYRILGIHACMIFDSYIVYTQHSMISLNFILFPSRSEAVTYACRLGGSCNYTLGLGASCMHAGVGSCRIWPPGGVRAWSLGSWLF